MKKITIASYTPFLKDVDDAILKKYLINEGANVEVVSWDNKNYDWTSRDLVIIRSTWDYYKQIDNYIEWLKYLKNNNVFVLNDIDTIINNIQKDKQITWIKDNNLLIAETHIFSKYDNNCLYPEETLIKTLEKYFNKYINKSMFVLKLSISAYTEKLYLVDPYHVNKDSNCIITEDYEAAFHELLNKGKTKKLIIQVYLEGIKDGEYGLVFLNQKFCWAVVKKPGRIYGKESMVHILQKDIPKKVLKYAKHIVDLYDKDKTLYCRVDLIMNNNIPYLMEIELAEPDLYIRLGDNIDINVVNPDYYLPLVERRGIKSKKLISFSKNIMNRIDNNNYKYVEDIESAKYYDALPRFTKDVYDYLNINNSIVADIGSGTGRIAIDLLERNNTIYAIDIDDNMRKICDEKCSKYKDKYISINGSDEKMNIKTKSVDYVISSQSFHRFNTIKFKNECNRVLKDNKNIFIIWYRIDFNNPIYKDMLISLKNNYKDYKTRYGNKSEIEGALEEEILNNESAKEFFNNKSVMKEINSKPQLSEEEFITLGLSLSLFPITHEMNTVTKVLNSKDFNKEQYIKDLKNIFKQYSKNNKIELIFKVQIHSSK